MANRSPRAHVVIGGQNIAPVSVTVHLSRTKDADDFAATPPGVRQVDLGSHPALAPWREAREALMRDADAALPK